MNVDLEALIRAVIIGISAGFLVNAIAYFVIRNPAERVRVRPVLFMGGGSLVLILIVALYYWWPSLVEVPRLDGKSQAEAEALITNNRLIPDARPQSAIGVEAGRVVPGSQSPNPGLLVKRGTVVSFGISTSVSPKQDNNVSGEVGVSIFQPKGGETAHCTPGPDGIYTFAVSGTTSSVPAGFSLLLWVKPVKPPAERRGWYLQTGSEIREVKSNGSWTGVAQLGNAQYPPHEGDIFDLAVSIADKDTVNQLMGERAAVIRSDPIGISTNRQSGVIVTLKLK